MPLHIQREGEPPRPIFTHQKLKGWGLPKAEEESQGRLKWLDWMKQQPDKSLLHPEYLIQQEWTLREGKTEEWEILDYWGEYRKRAAKLREQGYGELLDTCWPHLAEKTEK